MTPPKNSVGQTLRGLIDAHNLGLRCLAPLSDKLASATCALPAQTLNPYVVLLLMAVADVRR